MNAIDIEKRKQNTIQESEIISRILDGEKELYEILVRRINQILYRVIRSYLKSEMEIEDVMQDAYLKAFTKLYQFRLDASFSTWLIRIGINEALTRIKEKSRYATIDQSSDENNRNSILEIPSDDQSNPYNKMIQNEANQLLEKAIDSLESKYRIVFVLKEVEEMSLKEIASTLDLSVANVKVRIHRSRQMIKEKLYQLKDAKSIYEFGYSKCDRVTERVMESIS